MKNHWLRKHEEESETKKYWVGGTSEWIVSSNVNDGGMSVPPPFISDCVVFDKPLPDVKMSGVEIVGDSITFNGDTVLKGNVTIVGNLTIDGNLTITDCMEICDDKDVSVIDCTFSAPPEIMSMSDLGELA